MSKEPTRPVELTLEETGTLCHLLMRELLLPAMKKPKEVLDIEQPFLARMEQLWLKLSAANDQLMGKK